MPHPRIGQFEELLVPVQSAGAMGYRLPGEWEPQAAVWVSPPANPETWPRCLTKASRQFEAWIDELRRFAPICTPHSLGIPTDDAWIRDYGPIFVLHDPQHGEQPDAAPARRSSASGDGYTGRPQRTRHVLPPSPLRPLDVDAPPLAVHDFRFNTWGGKYEPQPRDDVVAQHLARWLGAPVWVHDFVLEGGAIDSNGRGTIMTTEQCLLHPGRNPDWSKQRIEAMLAEALGASHFIWLAGGITGDDTDGHIDTVARFVSPDTVVAVSVPEGHGDHAMLGRNVSILRGSRDQAGEPLRVVELPLPEPMFYEFPPDRFDAGGRKPLPATYANFLICNGGVFVPTFGQASDDVALRTLESVLPGYEIVPVRSEWLIVGQGAAHCLSMPQPAVRYSTVTS